MKSAISLLLCASIISDTNAINISVDTHHKRHVCMASEFNVTHSPRQLSQHKNDTKKPS